MNILIIGDSFATKYNGAYLGWAEMLEQKHTVTNLAQAGVSEYKILKQLQSITIKDFDCVIVSHTYFDLDYANYVYNLIHKEITSLLTDARVIDTDQLDLKKLFSTDRGEVQHLSEQANITFYNRLGKHIQ